MKAIIIIFATGFVYVVTTAYYFANCLAAL